MNPVFIVGLIALLPVAVFTVLKVNAAKAFMALCLGSILSTYVLAAFMDFLRGYVAPGSQTVETVVGLLLLWLPVVFVALFMGRTISSKQRFLNVLPGLAVGLMGVLLTVPLLPPDTQRAIYETNIWQILSDYQALIAIFGTTVSLLLFKMHAPLGEHHKGKHRTH